MVIKGAIFDIDGTVLDSMYVWENIGAEYLATLGVAPDPDVWEAIRSLSLKQAAEYFLEKYGERFDLSVDRVTEQINDMIADKYFYEVKAKPGVAEFLGRLRGAGIKICVATATDRYLIEAALEREGLMDYFGAIFTCAEQGSGKDDPGIFLAARDFLGTSTDETMVFEDAWYAIVTAKRAGFPVTAVRDPSSEWHRGLILQLADAYIDSYLTSEWGFI